MPAVVGEKVAEVPVAIEVPPQLPSYHFQLAPAPRKPPDKETLVVCPRQIVAAVVLAEVAGLEVSLRLMVMLRQMVLLQIPSALTK